MLYLSIYRVICILDTDLYRCAWSCSILGHVENVDGNGGFAGWDTMGVIASFPRRQREEYKWNDDKSVGDAKGCRSKLFNSHARRHCSLLSSLCTLQTILCRASCYFTYFRSTSDGNFSLRFQCPALPMVDPRIKFYERSAKEQTTHFRRRGIIVWEIEEGTRWLG